MTKRCCANCFSDEHIQRFIKDLDEIGNCDYCAATQVHTGLTNEVGEFLREGLEKAYQDVDSAGIPYDSAEGGYLTGTSVIDVLLDELSILSEDSTAKAYDLLKDLLSDGGPSPREIQRGADDWLSGGDALLVERGFWSDDDAELTSWRQFKRHIKYFARFFDLGRPTRRTMLQAVGQLMNEVATVLSRGSLLYRARVLEKRPTAGWSAQDELGPPPASSAIHSRMSPDGISYMYLSDSEETCLAEKRPEVGDRVGIGIFQLTVPLIVVNLGEVSRKSIFDPSYSHRVSMARSFLDDFVDEISRPLSPRETGLEYVPTQVLTEYIRSLGFQGVKYRSSQVSSGVNYVLFCGPQDKPQGTRRPRQRKRGKYVIPPFTRWMVLDDYKLVKVMSVLYASESMIRPLPNKSSGNRQANGKRQRNPT